MINEWEEFCAYTGTVSYTASKKSDTTWLGRFTFATILEFEGMARILTVLARGYLFHGEDGAVISGDPHDRVDYSPAPSISVVSPELARRTSLIKSFTAVSKAFFILRVARFSSGKSFKRLISQSVC